MSKSEPICTAVRARFSELLEGDLGDEARREIEAHLAGCAGCAASLARFRGVITALGRLSRPEPPADLPDRIDRALDALGTAAVKERRAPERRRLARHAVAALLVGGIIVGIIRVIPEVGRPLPARKVEAPAPLRGPAAPAGELAAEDRAAPPIPEQAREEAGALEKKAAPGRRAEPRAMAGSDLGNAGSREARPRGDEAPIAAGAAAGKPGPASRAPERDERAKAAEAPAAGVTVAAPALKDAMRRAAPAGEQTGAEAPSYYAPREGEPGGTDYARGLLLAAHTNTAWVAAVRDLALAHPDDLASAWAGIDANTRETILAVWGRAPAPPGLREDLTRAKAGATAPAARDVIDVLIGALRPPEP